MPMSMTCTYTGFAPTKLARPATPWVGANLGIGAIHVLVRRRMR